MNTRVPRLLVHHASHCHVEKGERCEQDLLAMHHRAEARDDIAILPGPPLHVARGGTGGGVAQLCGLYALEECQRIYQLRASRGIHHTKVYGEVRPRDVRKFFRSHAQRRVAVRV